MNTYAPPMSPDPSTPGTPRLSGHALQRMQQRDITLPEVHDAYAEHGTLRRAGTIEEWRGHHGVTLRVDVATNTVVTVLTRWSAPPLAKRTDCGVSRHRPDRRATRRGRPGGPDSSTRPGTSRGPRR